MHAHMYHASTAHLLAKQGGSFSAAASHQYMVNGTRAFLAQNMAREYLPRSALARASGDGMLRLQARSSYKCHLMQHPLHDWMPAAFPMAGARALPATIIMLPELPTVCPAIRIFCMSARQPVDKDHLVSVYAGV